MSTKLDQIHHNVIEQGTDIKWIKKSIEVLHMKADKTNGRLLGLESRESSYLKRDDVAVSKEKVLNGGLDRKTKITVAWISVLASAIVAVLAVVGILANKSII